ncbi:MAG: MarR family transcriptional regulator [Clostridiales Family XIII bacterium]|nr:MarR family transcriptional regulator [Clostridiales Family XIII bacterium]
MNELKMRILLCLYSMEGHCSNVTRLAKVFNVAKSTISRACDWHEESGLIRRTGERGRQIELSAYGKKTAAVYERRRSLSERWLRAQGVENMAAEKDAILFALGISEQTEMAFEQKLKQLQVKDGAGGRREISGKTICEILGDGRHSFTCVFHKCKVRYADSSLRSMANDGIERVGEMIVENGNGIVALTANRMERVSALGDLVVSGSLQTLQYYDGDKAHPARREGNKFFFPLEAVEFLNVEGIQYLQGSAVLRMSCSAGNRHMPESDAIFTMFL